MEIAATAQYVVLAIALLGSPGPGIISLLAVGRLQGLGPGLRYFGGLQLGLALGAVATALGLVSVLRLYPPLYVGLTLGGVAYLVHLGWRIATSPTSGSGSGQLDFSSTAGFFVGIANIKALPAFAALFASPRLIAADPTADIQFKWLLCVGVMLAVDIAWLLAGVALGKSALRPATERWFNGACGVTLMVAAISLLPSAFSPER